MIFTGLTSKIFGGVAVVAALGLTVQTMRLSSAKSALQDKQNDLAGERLSHYITRSSVGKLEKEIEAFNAAANQRAAALAKARQDAAINEKLLQRSADATDRQIAALTARIGQNKGGQVNRAADAPKAQDCPTPDLEDIL